MHMAQSVINWGSLWAHSGYCFKSGNGRVLKAIHSAKAPVYQVCRNLMYHRNEIILRQHVKRNPLSAVMNYITYLDKKETKATLKLGNVRYFGFLRKVADNWKIRLQLTNESKSYKKIVKNRCLYTTDKNCSQRSNNCYVMMKNNMYVKTSEFIVNIINATEYIICEKLTVEQIFQGLECHIKKVTSISDHYEALLTQDIEKVCVFCETEKITTICEVPNLKYY